MKPKARLKVTLSCNKRCKYCINKDKQYQSRWKTIESIYDIDWYRFRSIIISGGEPTILPGLVSICRELRMKAYYNGPPIYLQTNGYGLTKALVSKIDHYIDGIGYSIHDMNEFDHIKTRLKDISRIKPVRLYLKDTVSSKLPLIDKNYFDIRIWEEGESDEKEEIFVIRKMK